MTHAGAGRAKKVAAAAKIVAHLRGNLDVVGIELARAVADALTIRDLRAVEASLVRRIDEQYRPAPVGAPRCTIESPAGGRCSLRAGHRGAWHRTLAGSPDAPQIVAEWRSAPSPPPPSPTPTVDAQGERRGLTGQNTHLLTLAELPGVDPTGHSD